MYTGNKIVDIFSNKNIYPLRRLLLIKLSISWYNKEKIQYNIYTEIKSIFLTDDY